MVHKIKSTTRRLNPSRERQLQLPHQKQTRQSFHGGAFKVDAGASLTFGTPVIFSGTSVVAGKQGGAISNKGLLVFEHSSRFSSCSMLNPTETMATAAVLDVAAVSEQDGLATVGHWSCGGAVYNGATGLAWFLGATWFEDNRAGDGSAGGGLCNEGVAEFTSRTYFRGNSAAGKPN